MRTGRDDSRFPCGAGTTPASAPACARDEQPCRRTRPSSLSSSLTRPPATSGCTRSSSTAIASAARIERRRGRAPEPQRQGLDGALSRGARRGRAGCRARQALLDGEVAVVLPDGRTSFQALQNASEPGAAGRARLLRLRPPAPRRRGRRAACRSRAQGAARSGLLPARARRPCCATRSTSSAAARGSSRQACRHGARGHRLEAPRSALRARAAGRRG